MHEKERYGNCLVNSVSSHLFTAGLNGHIGVVAILVGHQITAEASVGDGTVARVVVANVPRNARVGGVAHIRPQCQSGEAGAGKAARVGTAETAASRRHNDSAVEAADRSATSGPQSSSSSSASAAWSKWSDWASTTTTSNAAWHRRWSRSV
ncbi:hypothetical protein TYRP_017694 [Tyrophagus putrescentiae]|nr:hypothetical protein TYRP_017694 [Tyrophagus putrescentiae]